MCLDAIGGVIGEFHGDYLENLVDDECLLQYFSCPS